MGDDQLMAFKKGTTQMLTLLEGPPGTGKTTIAMEIIFEWLRQS